MRRLHYILIIVILGAVGCGTPNHYPVSVFSDGPARKTAMAPIPPVERNAVTRMEFIKPKYGEWNNSYSEEPLLVVTNRGVISRMYKALSDGISTNDTTCLCGYLARTRWYGNSTNLLFSADLGNSACSLSLSFSSQNQDFHFAGSNAQFTRTIYAFMCENMSDQISKTKNLFEQAGKNYETLLFEEHVTTEQPDPFDSE